MSKNLFKQHLQRLKMGANQAKSLDEVSRWIEENTFINGKHYSFHDHEYQKRILDSRAREVVVRKCSQVGITELAVRKTLALCGMLKNFTAIYTLPTASFAATLMKTRVNPIINESPFLKSLVTDIDNVDVKQLGTSYLYLKGAASTNAPISIPASILVHDELDFSDSMVISQYQSRLTHSEHKMKFKLSTPTVPGKGIDFEFARSRRHFMFVKCCHCNHSFIPDYYEHVRVPDSSTPSGISRTDLRDITKRTLHLHDYEHAYVECPSCGGKPDLSPAYREWVCENPDDNYVAEGFQVSPFDAPKIIKPGYLIEASTQYANIADFINFNLGIPYYSSESVLSPEEVRATCTTTLMESGACVMGIDLGKTCHVVVARLAWDGAMQVVHVEAVPLQLLKERYSVLRLQYRVRSAVIDSLPYTDLVLSLQASDPNLWASVYTDFRGIELFTVKQRDEDDARGLQQLRQINVSRGRTFDSLMAFIRSGQFSKKSCPQDEVFVQHCTDMRRVKDWSAKAQKIEFKWMKSEMGEDHYWFALSYAYLASHILGTANVSAGVLPLVSTFRVHEYD